MRSGKGQEEERSRNRKGRSQKGWRGSIVKQESCPPGVFGPAIPVTIGEAEAQERQVSVVAGQSQILGFSPAKKCLCAVHSKEGTEIVLSHPSFHSEVC